ncbi:hypothetical protein ACFLZ6_00470 [Nanoarchaeota archaeon]
MGFIDFLSNIFDESEEELKKQIKEAELLRKEAEAKLKKIKKNKPKKKKKSNVKYFVIPAILALVVVVLISILNIGGGEPNGSQDYVVGCMDESPCEDCEFVVLCPSIEEGEEDHYLHFTLENRLEENLDCVIHLNLEGGGGLTHNKTMDVGVIAANKRTAFKTKITVPGGKSTSTIVPVCEKTT